MQSRMCAGGPLWLLLPAPQHTLFCSQFPTQSLAGVTEFMLFTRSFCSPNGPFVAPGAIFSVSTITLPTHWPFVAPVANHMIYATSADPAQSCEAFAIPEITPPTHWAICSSQGCLCYFCNHFACSPGRSLLLWPAILCTLLPHSSAQTLAGVTGFVLFPRAFCPLYILCSLKGGVLLLTVAAPRWLLELEHLVSCSMRACAGNKAIFVDLSPFL